MGDEYDLLQDWYERLLVSKCEYREPLFGAKTNLIVKKTCDALKQDGHVFVMALEILEMYGHAKNQTQSKIDNELLTVCVCILIASKCTGDAVQLKTKHLEAYVIKIAEAKDTCQPRCSLENSIRKIELEVLSTIRTRIPATTRLDDVVTVAEKLQRDLSLNAPLLPACVAVLELVCVRRRRLHRRLRALYVQNPDALAVFRLLATSRAYLPVGVLLATLRLTNYRFSLNLDKIADDYSTATMIHRDHLCTLADEIVELVRAVQRYGGDGGEGHERLG